VFTASVYEIITLVGSNQCNYFENATACSKRKFKTTVATQLYGLELQPQKKVKLVLMAHVDMNRKQLQTPPIYSCVNKFA